MKELIMQFLENCKSDLIQDQVAKRMTTTGKSAASLEIVDVSDSGGSLLASDAILAQIFGRKPGKQPPTNGIIEWIEAKGIPHDGISVESLAFLIARKIGREGTDIYKGLQPALAFYQIVAVNTDWFIREVHEEYERQIQEQILKAVGQ